MEEEKDGVMVKSGTTEIEEELSAQSITQYTDEVNHPKGGGYTIGDHGEDRDASKSASSSKMGQKSDDEESGEDSLLTAVQQN